MNSAEGSPATVIGRYALFEEIAAGGMATVHYGRLLGPVGFSRTVAIKRLHPHLARDPEFAAMFLDEARVAARVRHPNVVPTLDIVSTQGELFLVMEYVQGESLARLLRAARRRNVKMPPAIATAIIVGTLHGLHAAHEAKNERGQPLGIVHRDVSPQNVLVGLDGIPRLVDFGVAKAAGRVQTTREGQLKGKIAYMAPEQIRGAQPTRLVDVYACAILFWEMLTGDRLFGGDNDVTVLERALHMEVKPPSAFAEVPQELDTVVLKGLSRNPQQRFQSAREMAREIENVTQVASVSNIGEWVELMAGEVISERAAKVAEIESRSQIRPAYVAQAPAASTPPPSAPRSSTPNVNEAQPQAPASGADEIPVALASERPPGMPSKQRKLVVYGVMGAATLLLVVVVIVAIASGMKHGSSAAASANSAAVTTPTLQAPTPTTVTATPPTTAATDRNDVAPTATTTASSASTRPAPTHTAATAYTAPQVTSRPVGAAQPTISAHPTGKGNCNPPYTVDSNGVKQYKVECL